MSEAVEVKVPDIGDFDAVEVIEQLVLGFHADEHRHRLIDARVAGRVGHGAVDAQMQDIEREAMDIQLQDKLLE